MKQDHVTTPGAIRVPRNVTCHVPRHVTCYVPRHVTVTLATGHVRTTFLCWQRDRRPSKNFWQHPKYWTALQVVLCATDPCIMKLGSIYIVPQFLECRVLFVICDKRAIYVYNICILSFPLWQAGEARVNF